MNLEKSKKRIAKKLKMGFQGYPTMTIIYSGTSSTFAQEVVVELVLEEGAERLVEKFTSKMDAREDEVIQSVLVKMIERSGAKTLVQAGSVIVGA